MAGKSKIVTGALEGLADVFARSDADVVSKGASKEMPANVFETKSFDAMSDDLMQTYEQDYGDSIGYDEIKNFVFSEDSIDDLENFFAGKVSLDDVEYNNDNLARLIIDLSGEGFSRDQIMNLMSPVLKQKQPNVDAASRMMFDQMIGRFKK